MACPFRLRFASVIVGGILVHLTLGTIYTFGNFTVYLTSYFRKHGYPNLRYTDSIWIFALAVTGQGFSMFIGGLLEQQFGPRITTLIGSWLMSAGVLISYFTVQKSFAATAIAYGLMFGLGTGMAYAIPMGCAMSWLPEKKGLMSGVIVSGFGGGAFIFNQIQTLYLNPNNEAAVANSNMEKYFVNDDILDRVPSCFLLLGGVYAAMQLIGSFLLAYPPEPQQLEKQPILTHPSLENESDEGNADINDKQGLTISALLDQDESLHPKHVLKKCPFYVLWLIFLLNGQGVIFTSSLYKAYGQTFIQDDHFLALIGSFSAIFNAGGRLFWGYLGDRFSFKVAMVTLCGSFASLLLLFTLTSLVGKALFFIWVCLIFFTFSGNFSLFPLATARSFGMRYYSFNYGLVFTSQCVTGIIGATLSSTVSQVIGWSGIFYLVAGFSVASMLLAMAFSSKKPDGSGI